MKRITTLFTALLISGFLHAQNDVPYRWIEGTWVGDGFGGTSEEVWSAPSADGTIMGSFRHFKGDGSLNFYEF